MSRLTKAEANFCIKQIFGEGFYAATCKPWRKATIKYVAYHYPAQPLIAYYVTRGHETWEEALDAARQRVRVMCSYNAPAVVPCDHCEAPTPLAELSPEVIENGNKCRYCPTCYAQWLEPAESINA